MMATYLRPPRVHHRLGHTADDRDILCFQAASNIRMSRGERSLLCFYAGCSNGFRPALQHIADQIGVDRRHIARLRSKLEEHGVIKVADDTVHVDWQRICTFASLDPAMTGRHATFAPVSLDILDDSPPPDSDFFQLAPLEEVISWFARQTPSDLSRWRWNLYRSRKKASNSQAS